MLREKFFTELKILQQEDCESCFYSARNCLETNVCIRDGCLSHKNVLSLEEQNNRMSGNPDTYHFNGENLWNVKDEFSQHSLLTAQPFSMYQKPCFSNEAHLVITVPPENRFRYRYDTEMSGTHGSLQGVRTGREKCVPTVKLLNCSFEALIRVSLVTCKDESEYYPHPHSLFVKEKLYQKKMYTNWDGKNLTKTGHYADPHYIKVGGAKSDFTARFLMELMRFRYHRNANLHLLNPWGNLIQYSVFEGMCIINSKKENFHVSVRQKLRTRLLEQKYDLCGDDSLSFNENEDLSRKVELAVSYVDVDFVNLCFEAFREENGKLFPICQPVFSEPIGNAKSAKTGKLKISRINKCYGSCKGGDEIWLLVEKINKKGLLVRFWEECNGKTIWESCIEGDDLILHHQYAIIFKTPPFKDMNILSEAEVLMRLERATQPNQPFDYSEPITFVYEPLKNKLTKGDHLCRKESILTPMKQSQTKRPRTEIDLPSFNSQYKRKTDFIESEHTSFEESDGDIDQLLSDIKNTFEFDQAWAKFNMEEFLKFLSWDDVDMPMQKDGTACSSKFCRDLLYKMYMLYSKLDESDIKKLTEQISNFKVSKQEGKIGKNGDKDQVKDAASTLLTLRSKALINNTNNNVITIGNNNYRTGCGKKEINLKKPRDENQSFKVNGSETRKGKNGIITSNFKLNLPKTLTDELGFEMNEIEEPCAVRKVREQKSGDNIEKWENFYYILNKNGSWRALANAVHCSSAVTSAAQSLNPAKYILECFQEIHHGQLELEMLIRILKSIEENEAFEVLNQIMKNKST